MADPRLLVGTAVLYTKKALKRGLPVRAHLVTGTSGKYLLAWKVDYTNGTWVHPGITDGGKPGLYQFLKFKTLREVWEHPAAFNTESSHGARPTAMFRMDSLYRLATEKDLDSTAGYA